MGRRNRVRLLALLALGGCRDEAPSPCAVAPSHQRHACEHAREGPYASLDGRLRPAPLARDPHTHYTVVLAAEAGGTFGGQVRFQAPRSGCWAFYVGGAETLSLEETCHPRGRFQTTVAVTACQELNRVFTLAMAGGERVLLALRGGQAQGGVLVERLASLPGEGDAARPSLACPDAPSADDGGPADTRPPPDAIDSASAEVTTADAPGVCRTSGPCTRHDECCDYCHDGDHCH